MSLNEFKADTTEDNSISKFITIKHKMKIGTLNNFLLHSFQFIACKTEIRK